MTMGNAQDRWDDLPGGERSGAVKFVRPTRHAWYYARDKSAVLFDPGCRTSLHGLAIEDLKVEL